MQQQNTKIQSLNLIKIINDKIVLNQQAAQNFCKYDGPFSIVSACGEYRTGKSFLLNMMFYKDCFDVSPSIEACTKGINMVSCPFQLKGKNIWIFDTQGFGSCEQDGTYDAKIFLLTILLSELVIYNSVGSLDQISLQKIALMCKKAEMLTKSQDIQQNKQDSNVLRKHTQLYWIIRDFSLSLTNKDGVQINSDQYLQQALNRNLQKNQSQRKLIKRIFKQRKCFPLVRPCISQANLQSLKDIPMSSFRSQFREEVKKIKNNIINSIQNKSFYGNYLTGAQFVQLLKRYIKMINQMNFQVNLNATWQQIQEHQKEIILNKIEQQIMVKINQYKQFMPITLDNRQRLFKQIQLIENRNLAHIRIENQTTFRDSMIEIRQYMLNKLDKQNKQQIAQNCTRYSQGLLQQIFIRLQNYSNFQNFKQNFDCHIGNLNKNYELNFNGFDPDTVSIYYNKIQQKVINWLVNKKMQKLALQLKQSQQIQNKLHNIIEQLKLQLNLRITLTQNNKKQLQQQKIKYQNSLISINNYIQIIARMQKVSQTLRIQFQHLQQSQSQSKILYAQKIKEYDCTLQIEKQKSQILKITLQQLQKLNTNLEYQLELSKKQNIQIKQMYVQQLKKIRQQNYQLKQANLQQNKAIRQKCQQTIEIQRDQFQKIIYQKNRQLIFIQQQMKQKQLYVAKIKEQMFYQINYTRNQYEQNQRQYKIKYQKQVQQLKQRIKVIEFECQKLREQVKVKDDQILLKHQQMIQIQNQLKVQLDKVQNRQKQTKQQLKQKQEQNNKINNLNQQQKHKINILKQQLTSTRLKSKQDIQALSLKLNESLKMHTVTSQQKYNTTKKQLQIQKQKIVNKLVQAAQRIQQMTQKQKQQFDKIQKLQNKIQCLEIQMQKQKTKQCNECKQSLLKIKQLEQTCEQFRTNNSQLQEIIEIQSKKIERINNKNKSRCKIQSNFVVENENIQIKDDQIINQNQNQKRSKQTKQVNQDKICDRNIQKLKTTIYKYSKQNKKLRSQIKMLRQNHNQNNYHNYNHFHNNNNNHNPSKNPIIQKQNPQNNKNQVANSVIKVPVISIKQQQKQLKIKLLQQQNMKLIKQMQVYKNKAQKWHSDTMKKINLHTVMKKLKSYNKNDNNNNDDLNNNYKNELIIQQTVNIQINQTQSQNHKYTYTQTYTQNYIKQLQYQLTQLNNLILIQNTKILQLQQVSKQKQQQIRIQQKQYRNKRIIIQQKISKYQLQINNNLITIQQLNNKIGYLKQQVNLYKNKVIKMENIQQTNQRYNGYKQKINQLFTTL